MHGAASASGGSRVMVLHSVRWAVARVWARRALAQAWRGAYAGVVELATSGSFLEALAHIENDAVLLSHLVCVTLALERVQLLEAALVLAALDERLGDVLEHGGALLGRAVRLAERLEQAGRLDEDFRCDAKRLREVLRSTLELVKLTLLGFVRPEVCRSLVGAVHWRGGAHDH